MERGSRGKGSVLVVVLWCVVLLGIAVISNLHTTRLELRVVKNHGDRIQARYLALAGIEKAKALLYLESKGLLGNSEGYRSDLFDNPHQFRDIPLGRGQFRVFRQARREETAGIVYGVSDEGSRLNLNHAGAEELGKLQGMTREMAAAILDYRDEDQKVTPGGAEFEEYAALVPPYIPRDGPLLTLRELLMVQGIRPDLFLGEDANQNGLLDRDENDGDRSPPVDNRNGYLDAGWSGVLTVNSSVENRNSRGRMRVNIKNAKASEFASVDGISSDLASAIVAYRDENSFESLTDLLNVTVVQKKQGGGANPQPANRPRGQSGYTFSSTSSPGSRSSARPPSPSQPQSSSRPPPSGGSPLGGSPSGGSPSGGARLVSQELFKDIADDLTVQSDVELPGRVNLNTASAVVLSCLQGIDENLAHAIVTYRQANGPFPGVAYLLDVPNVNQEILKTVSSRVTTRLGTFLILSEGMVNSSGARQRIQVTVKLDSYGVEVLSYREDL